MKRLSQKWQRIRAWTFWEAEQVEEDYDTLCWWTWYAHYNPEGWRDLLTRET